MMKRRTMLCALLALLLATLCACSAPQTAAAPPKPCADIAGAIEKAQTFEELTALADAQILKYLDLNEAMLSDMAMLMDASRMTAECVIVLTATDQEALGQAQEALLTYRDVTLEQYRDYRPEEVPKLEAAILQTNGLQTVLIVSPDAATAENTLKDAWK